MNKQPITPVLLFFCFLAFACSEKKNTYDRMEDIPVTELQMVYAVEETEDFFLARPWDATADRDGNFYVVDAGPTTIYVFSPEGKKITSIGREGQGPGEFSSINSLFFDSKGSLHVYDGRSRSVSIFSKLNGDWVFQRKIQIKSPSGSFLTTLQRVDDETYLGIFTTFMFGGEESTVTPDKVHLIDSEGELSEEPIMSTERMEMVFIQRGDNMMNVMRPFGLVTILRVTPDGLIYRLRTNEAFIDKYNLSGELTGRIGMHIEPLPVTDEARSDVIARMGEVIRNEVPSVQPVVNEMFISAEGNAWLQIGERNKRQWLVLGPDGNALMRTFAPEEVNFRYASGNRVYATSFTYAEAYVFEW